MRLRLTLLALTATLLTGGVAATVAVANSHTEAAAADPALAAAVAGDWRSAQDKARDRWRRPAESLAFWGLRPGMTVVEIDPGGGAWWSQILAPYARATNGRFIGVVSDPGTPAVEERAAASRQRLATALSDARYGPVTVARMTPAALDVPAGSADMVLVARAFHNWARSDGRTDAYMRNFFTALKPGGVLAVEQHRLPAGQPERPESGYVSEQSVIDAAQRAGFVLEARSEINANPADDTDHPFGVWTLPPVRNTAANGQPANPAFDRAAYDAIGESDRMTLRFRKPA